MRQSPDDLAELAELIAEEHFVEGKVDLDSIAKSKDIKIVEGEYGDCPEGHLIHEHGNFYIQLNNSRIDPNIPGRKRFTIAHEYGHYFNDDHRNKLVNGISLSYSGGSGKNQIEREADHFASNLLLPKARVTEACRAWEVGFQAILGIHEQFITSIESTALKYISLDLIPCIFFKWNKDLSFKYASYTSSFSKLTGVTGKPVVKALDSYVSEVFRRYDNLSKGSYVEEATVVSKWIGTVLPTSSRDLVGLEQTLKLGDFGGITLLTFHH